MTRILSLDTSTKSCSVALHEDGDLIATQVYHLQQSHSSLLPSIIKELLDNCSLEMSDLDAIALSAGPGSYTGLRIGTATVKGLCYALEVPMIAVDTLDTMIAQVYPIVAGHVNRAFFCPMIDARRMEVYCKLINQSQEVLWNTSPVIVDDLTFMDFKNTPLILFGNGCDKLRDVLDDYDVSYIEDIHPSASSMGKLAYDKFKNELFEDLAYFEPDYLKEFHSKVSSKKTLG